MDAWCVDIADFLQGSGTYTLGAPPPPSAPALTVAQIAKIGGLMKYGNANIGAGYDYSSAVQIAIWAIEYGADFSWSGSTDANLVANLVADNKNGKAIYPGDSSWTTLSSTNDQGLAINQTLGSMVPEPAAWAMMLVGFGAVGAMMRRNGKMAAAAA